MFYRCCFVWFHVSLMLFCLISCFTGVGLVDFMFHWCCFVWFHVLQVLFWFISCFTGVVLFDFMFYWCCFVWFHVLQVLFWLISCFTGAVLFDFMFYWCCFVWFHALLMHSCFTGVVFLCYASCVLLDLSLCSTGVVLFAAIAFMFHLLCFACCNSSLMLFGFMFNSLVFFLFHFITCVALFIRIKICNVLSDIFPLSLDTSCKNQMWCSFFYNLIIFFYIILICYTT